MSKYICSNCGRVLDEEELAFKSEQIGERYSDREEYAVCSHCGSCEIEDAVECEICGQYHSSDDLTDGICLKCIEDLYTRFEEATKDFTEFERGFLFENIDFDDWIAAGRD